MLTDLRIKNLALVNDLAIQFGPGYNSITGETGAGKSILIGALGLVLGERADRTLIRDGDDHCSVEAIIEVAALGKAFHSHLDQNGIEPCAENQLFLIMRQHTRRCYLTALQAQPLPIPGRRRGNMVCACQPRS
jgi:DNA repair protein RecN (Recombination protein N)